MRIQWNTFHQRESNLTILQFNNLSIIHNFIFLQFYNFMILSFYDLIIHNFIIINSPIHNAMEVIGL